MKNNISRSEIDSFLKSKVFALYGVSKDKMKFGNSILKELIAKNYKVVPIHPKLNEVNGVKCYKTLTDSPVPPDAAIITMNPENTHKVLDEIYAAGIKNLWIQQRSESEDVISFCREKNMNVIYGHCIIMFAEPAAFIHKFHRWIKKVSGSLPQ